MKQLSNQEGEYIVNITVEQMIEEMPGLAKIVMPPRSRISRKNLISLIYYQQKVEEVWKHCRGADWAQIMICLENQRRGFPEGTVGYDYWNRTGDYAKRSRGGYHHGKESSEL